MRVGVGSRYHVGTWDTENPDCGNTFKVNVDADLGHSLVRCGNGFKLWHANDACSGLVDVDVAHARSTTARQQPPNRYEERVGREKNRGGRTTNHGKENYVRHLQR